MSSSPAIDIPAALDAAFEHLAAGRVGASLLASAGMPALIAHDEEAYVRIALELAANPKELDKLRSRMWDKLFRSPLLDSGQLARHIEFEYRGVWRDWCRAST